MELRPDDFIIGWWFLGDFRSAIGPKDSDWMGTLLRRDGKYEFHYRHRYYAGPSHWDPNDTKNWYSGTLKADDDPAAYLKGCLMADIIAQQSKPHIIRNVEVMGDMHKFMRLMENIDIVETKVVQHDPKPQKDSE